MRNPNQKIIYNGDINELISILEEHSSKIIAVNGEQGHGKSYLTKFLSERKGYEVVDVDDYLFDEGESYQSKVDYQKLKEKISSVTTQFIIESPLLLDVLKYLEISDYFLVFVCNDSARMDWEGGYYNCTFDGLLIKVQNSIKDNEIFVLQNNDYKTKIFTNEVLRHMWHRRPFELADVVFIPNRFNKK